MIRRGKAFLRLSLPAALPGSSSRFCGNMLGCHLSSSRVSNTNRASLVACPLFQVVWDAESRCICPAWDRERLTARKIPRGLIRGAVRAKRLTVVVGMVPPARFDDLERADARLALIEFPHTYLPSPSPCAKREGVCVTNTTRMLRRVSKRLGQHTGVEKRPQGAQGGVMTYDSILFAHRRNDDGSYDSICRACFAAIVRSKPEYQLAQYEQAHDCESDFLAEPGPMSQAESFGTAHR